MNAGRAAYDEQCAEDGYDIVELSVSGNSCEECAKWERQIFSLTGTTEGIPTKQDLIDAGVFHPNCTHRYTVVTNYELKKRGYSVRQPDVDLDKKEKLEKKELYASIPGSNPGNPRAVISSENSPETIPLVTEPPTIATDSNTAEADEFIRNILRAEKVPDELSILERLERANDGAWTTEEKANNCQRCTVAFEMLCRGINVTAKPSILNIVNDKVSMEFDHVATNWHKRYIGYETQQVSIGGKSPEAQIKEISYLMKQYGDGARAEVFVNWEDDTRGHVFVAMQIDGKTIFLDPQTAEIDKKDYFNVCNLSGTKLTRVDNLQLNPSLIHHTCEAIK